MNGVSLIAITKPSLNIQGITTPEQLITYCARVSNPANQLNVETSPNLIRYLINHKHWSPFEMVSMTLEIKTSRAIATQILRHRSFSFQEFSQRYSTTSNIVNIDLRKQAQKNRQSSEESFDPFLEIDVPNEHESSKKASQVVSDHMNASMKLYVDLINAGVAKECARLVLPLATESTLYVSGTVRSWIHYLELRTTEDTQLEHRELALQIKDIFKDQFPDTYTALWGDQTSV